MADCSIEEEPGKVFCYQIRISQITAHDQNRVPPPAKKDGIDIPQFPEGTQYGFGTKKIKIGFMVKRYVLPVYLDDQAIADLINKIAGMTGDVQRIEYPF
jgi:hypothetical protein